MNEWLAADRKRTDDNYQRQGMLFQQVGTEIKGIKKTLEENRLRGPPLGSGQGGATLAQLEALQRKVADLETRTRTCPPSALSKENEAALKRLSRRIEIIDEVTESDHSILGMFGDQVAYLEEKLANVRECRRPSEGPRATSVAPEGPPAAPICRVRFQEPPRQEGTPILREGRIAPVLVLDEGNEFEGAHAPTHEEVQGPLSSLGRKAPLLTMKNAIMRATHAPVCTPLANVPAAWVVRVRLKAKIRRQCRRPQSRGHGTWPHYLLLLSSLVYQIFMRSTPQSVHQPSRLNLDPTLTIRSCSEHAKHTIKVPASPVFFT